MTFVTFVAFLHGSKLPELRPLRPLSALRLGSAPDGRPTQAPLPIPPQSPYEPQKSYEGSQYGHRSTH